MPLLKVFGVLIDNKVIKKTRAHDLSDGIFSIA